MEIDLKDIINRINNEKMKKFLYYSLVNDKDLLNRFRVEFSDFFPKLSKREYEKKIYNAIYSCRNRKGFIDYECAYEYEHVMLEFISEAKKLVSNHDYDTAFTVVTILLDSIPKTDIDDSNGSTGMVADYCIEIIFNILNKINSDSDKDNEILKEILNYVIKDVKSLYLYNYGIDLKEVLGYFIDKCLYLYEIEVSLEIALDFSKDKSYFYCRKDYVEYLTKIYTLKNENEKVIKVLKKYSFDKNVCMMYVEELLKEDKVDDAIGVLKSNLGEDNYKNNAYALEIAQIYFENGMIDEYRNILYDIFYKYSRHDFDIYLKIKKLYSKVDWKHERIKIIEDIKKDKDANRTLNQIYIEEEMYDDLFLNINHYDMDYIIPYEKYLLPKYRDELLDIYKDCCLNFAGRSNNRKLYREAAIKVNHIINMDGSANIVRLILKEINENYFRNRPAMIDEFESIIKQMDQYF